MIYLDISFVKKENKKDDSEQQVPVKDALFNVGLPVKM